MNMKDHFCLSRHLLPSIALYPTQENCECLLTKSPMYRVSHLSFLESSVLWLKTSIVFSLLGFGVQTNSDSKTQKKSNSEALKRYLNEKNLMNGRVMTTIQNLVLRLLKNSLV